MPTGWSFVRSVPMLFASVIRLAANVLAGPLLTWPRSCVPSWQERQVRDRVPGPLSYGMYCELLTTYVAPDELRFQRGGVPVRFETTLRCGAWQYEQEPRVAPARFERSCALFSILADAVEANAARARTTRIFF